MNERCCLRTDRDLTESDEECNLEGRKGTELLAQNDYDEKRQQVLGDRCIAVHQRLQRCEHALGELVFDLVHDRNAPLADPVGEPTAALLVDRVRR